MSNVRAYKLAEELKLDREDFVKRARELGIEIRNAMSGLDDEQAEFLRRRLGQATAETHTEQRVGQQVIRRRRRIVEDAAEPLEVAAEAPPALAPRVAAEPVAEPRLPVEDAEEAGIEVAPARELEPAASAPPAPGEAPAPLQARAPGDQPDQAVIEEALREDEGPSRVARPGEGRRVPARPASKRPAKREANEAANLREQDTLARSMLGNVQRRMEQRRVIVEQQARLQPRRRRAAALGPRGQSAAARKDRTLRLPSEVTLAELSGELGVKIRDLLRQARGAGLELDRDAHVDFETAGLIAAEFQFEVQPLRRDLEEALGEGVEQGSREPRPPVVTVMGHVDHGKTSLLDYIRQTKVTEGEAGGITQHIGAYMVHRESGDITFLDTPGHAAFTQMRARGAQVTDIVVLVVAADDGVMPQTIEAINHARAARVPMIVAINKIDKGDATPQRVKQGLLEQQIVLEEFGGEVIGVEVSATKGTNVDKLLEMINLQAEVLELHARTDGDARGVVIEAQLDRGRGPVATILVREGTLRRGDAFVIGTVSGRIRSLINESGQQLSEAPPAMPVQIVGLSAVPEAGDELLVVKSEREAKQIALHREADARRQLGEVAPAISADDLFASGEGEERELRVVLKADVRGTMEAIRDAIEKGSTEKVKASVIHAGVGGISENDVTFASASRAVVIGFHVVPEPVARRAAEARGVEVRTFDIVYELLDDVRALMQGLLPPRITEQLRGHAQVRELFTIPRIGTIAGCYVESGSIRRSDSIRVVRDGRPIYDGKIQSLRRFKDDAREVSTGMECGIHLERYNDLKVGDLLESFVLEETRETL